MPEQDSSVFRDSVLCYLVNSIWVSVAILEIFWAMRRERGGDEVAGQLGQSSPRLLLPKVGPTGENSVTPGPSYAESEFAF